MKTSPAAGPVGRLFLGMSLLAYAVSLFLQAIRGWPGWSAVLLGWLTLLSFCPANFTWLANPLVLIAWGLIFRGDRRWAIIFSIFAVGLAASFLLCDRVINNEGGAPEPIGERLSGYWLWLCSMILAAISSFTLNRKSKPNQSSDPTLSSGTSAAGQPPRLP
jgi:hypothetical protein